MSLDVRTALFHSKNSTEWEKKIANGILTCFKPDHHSKVVLTRTKPSDFPSLLRQKLSVVQTVERHKVQTERIDANTDCAKCGTRGIRYSEVQQRGADEGSTIVYNCDCGHKYDIPPYLVFMEISLTTWSQVVGEQLNMLWHCKSYSIGFNYFR